MLKEADIGFLEDCIADWRGLWEVAWMEPDTSLDQRAVFASGLVEKGLLDVLRIAGWSKIREAAPLSREDAIAIVSAPENYEAPGEGQDGLYVLAITAAGEAVVSEWHL